MKPKLAHVACILGVAISLCRAQDQLPATQPAAPPATQPAVQQLFRPTTTGSGKTHWSAPIPARNPQKPNDVFMLVAAHRGDWFPVGTTADQPPAFRGKIMAGNEKQVDLEIDDGTALRRIVLPLGVEEKLTIDGREFRLLNAKTWVAAPAPEHVDHATLNITFSQAPAHEQ